MTARDRGPSPLGAMMAGFELPNLSEVFVPDVSLIESIIRGTIVYFGILVLFRVVLKRQTGGVGLSDIMVIVLVSECVSTAINANSKSVGNGLLCVATILFWSFVVDWATYHWRWLHRRLSPAPLPLVRNGKLMTANMRNEEFTIEELHEQLRMRGVDDHTKVKTAILEPSGELSVIQNDTREDLQLQKQMSKLLAEVASLRSAIEQYQDRSTKNKKSSKK